MATTESIGGFLSVSAALPGTYDSTGFAALTWTDVEKAGEIPEFGAQYSVVTFTPLKTGIVDKFHGELNYGSVNIPMAFDPADAGQTIMKDAATSKDVISFRETRSDGSVRYITGKVFSYQTGAAVGSVLTATSMVEFDNATIDGA